METTKVFKGKTKPRVPIVRSMPLPAFGNAQYIIWAGPFAACPADIFSVKLAAEINAPADVDLPIADFSVPAAGPLLDALRQTLHAVGDRKRVYIGCKGGIGRTGLFLACLAKAWGLSDPVSYVRAQYLPEAVETIGQRDFIRNLRIPASIRFLVFRMKLRGLLARRKTLTNEGPVR